MAAEFEDLLVDFEGPARWKRLLLTLIGLGLLLAAGFAAYDTLVAKEGVTQAPPQTVEARRGPLSTSVQLTGTVAAQSTSQLNFESSGVVTKVNVNLGQEVKQGDVLAEIESTAAVDAVRQAELNLQAAQIRLNELTKPATAADTASADQSVLSAESALVKAEEDLRKLRQGPTAAETASAQQAVSSAQSGLAQAQAARDKLRSPNASSERTSAEQAVNQAQSAVQSAQSGITSADSAITTAQAGLYAAEAAFCPQSGVSFCTSRAAPISSSDESAMISASGNADKAGKATAVLQANAGYKNALTSRNDAAIKLDNARRDLATAQQKLAATPSGPTANEISQADAGLSAAQRGLESARAKLSELHKGPDASAIQTAESAVESAKAGLNAARAKREQTYAGAKQSDIDLQRNSIELQRLGLKKTQDDLAKTRMLAPFDGTIADLTIAVGDRAQGASSANNGSGSSAAITINTPNALRLDLTISESDLAKVKPGMRGIASFSGLEGAGFPVEIESVGTLPSTNQGVVTYEARGKILLLDAASAPPPIEGRPGAVTLPAGEAPPAGALPGTFQQGAMIAPNAAPGAGPQFSFSPATAGGTIATAPGASTSGAPIAITRLGSGSGSSAASKPAPGMQAQVTIVTESRSAVITVPARAVSREGLDSVVKVEKDDGSVETVKVKTGLSNGAQIEITEGLTEGQKVQLPVAAAPSGSSQGGQTPGNVQFFGPAPGGGAMPANRVIITGGP